MEIPEEDFENMVVNYDRVLEVAEFSAVTKMTAMMLQKNPYMSIGKYFKQLSDGDVLSLAQIVDRHGRGDEGASEELVLLTEMLSRAEGVIAKNLDESFKSFRSLIIMISCVALGRKGLVKVFYENLSFGDDMADAAIIEKLP
jgi:hypothetical protein